MFKLLLAKNQNYVKPIFVPKFSLHWPKTIKNVDNISENPL